MYLTDLIRHLPLLSGAMQLFWLPSLLLDGSGCLNPASSEVRAVGKKNSWNRFVRKEQGKREKVGRERREWGRRESVNRVVAPLSIFPTTSLPSHYLLLSHPRPSCLSHVLRAHPNSPALLTHFLRFDYKFCVNTSQVYTCSLSSLSTPDPWHLHLEILLIHNLPPLIVFLFQLFEFW